MALVQSTRKQKGRKEYMAWVNMRRRCADPKDDSFENYGGRGVTVCNRWQESFAAFLEDIGPAPSPHHTIDRIDNERGYEPGNVRWATRTEQQANRRTKAMNLVTFGGVTRTCLEWSKLTGIDHRTIWSRINQLGWTPEKALTTPARPYRLSAG
jgi:hypothetical protein